MYVAAKQRYNRCMKKTWVIAFIFILVFSIGVIGAACTKQETQKPINGETPANDTNDTQEPEESPPADDMNESPQADQEIKSDSENTIVTNPKENDVIKSPVEITGRAIAFENTVNIKIKDNAGNILAETFATTDSLGPGEFGDFSVHVDFEETDQEKGFIEVFQISAEDGSETDKVTIPVTFKSNN